jgi:hypothetical protein
VAEKLNKKSMLRFHAKLTETLRECNIINPQHENDSNCGAKIEKILSSIAQLQNQLKVSYSREEILKSTVKMT